MNDRRHYRTAVIGAGFGGVAVGAALGQAGIDYVILERAASIGGTWRDNTYPGCRCDVPSHLYSLSFAPTAEWTHTYSAQPEILAYLRQTADRLGVRGHIRLSHEVRAARWDPADCRWLLDTAGGPYSADVLISANGVLAEPAVPGLPGLDDFGGQVFHSARWDAGARLDGQRVGVVGTGASAVQIVPAIAPQVASLKVFQRTPAWILPHTDRPITSWERAVYRRMPAAQRAVRTAVYWQRELLVPGMKDPRRMALVRMVAARHLARQVPDPDLRKRLTPQYTPGCKRLVPSNDFYPALQQPHVGLVTDPIERLAGRGVVTGPAPGAGPGAGSASAWTTHELDVLILATGFRVTDNPVMARIQGADGTRLADVWAPAGPKAFLATTVAGFPNLFLINGPNSAIGHTSLLVMTEAQIPYIVGAIRALDEHRIAALDLRAEVQERYNTWLDGKLSRTVWNAGGCDSWYLHAHGRNSALWPDYTWRFRRLLGRFDLRPYRQLTRTP